MTEDTFTGCCAPCTCTDPHSSKPFTDVMISEGFSNIESFPITETSTNCCVECTCPDTHQSKPPVQE